MKVQNKLFDLFEEDEPTIGIGKAVRNATFSMIKPKLPEKRMRVYEVILSHPEGVTRKKIAREITENGWPINCVTGRVTELLNLNLIREDGIEYAPSHDGKMYPNGVLKPI